jgi:hypothetical protein
MKILNYKSLNEQSVYDQARSTSKATGISQGSMRTLVGANLKRDARIGKVPSVNAFRSLGFSFVTQQSYNDFLASNGSTDLQVYNNLLYTFAILYQGDSCYLYPYNRQSLTLESMKFVTSYLKLDLFKRADPNVSENIQQYFSQFDMKRSAENENNVKNYTLTLGANFDAINKKYGIPAEVKNLKNFTTGNLSEPMFISINGVSKEYAINTAYGQREEKYQILDIDFTPTAIPGFSSATSNNVEPYASFNTTFTDFTELRSKYQPTSRNLPQNLLTQYPYMGIFSPKNGNKTYIIYTDRPITNYLVVNQRVKCIIGRNNAEFYAAEMKVNSIG